ncbi:hypothetical protein SDC9_169807 [bioreactor metagenome]|uniref:Uncharacterized protein n=1 Tax=bioreactor metagenome TaxID=1076179 RepID=A0A645GEJ9_9ZZZZ
MAVGHIDVSVRPLRYGGVVVVGQPVLVDFERGRRPCLALVGTHRQAQP